MNTIQGQDISVLLITSTNIYVLFLYFFFRSFEEGGTFDRSHVSPIPKFFNFYGNCFAYTNWVELVSTS